MTQLLLRHFDTVVQVLSTFKKQHLYAKGAIFYMIAIKFCGHILSNGQRKAAPSKLEALKKWTPECIKNITHLKDFWG